MTIPLIITYPARSSLQQRRRPEKNSNVSTGRVPRLARLLALAIKFDNLLRSGTIRNHADLGHALAAGGGA